ncbi:MAG TPA: protoglobin domain-containing protein [Polyangia bacterium]|nr:protoglobin domain-containing protein [Polyangia bacterium]
MKNLTFLENMKLYVGFGPASSAALREAHPLVAPHFGPIIDDFYATIEAHPGARAAITGGAAQIQRLKGSLLRWIDEVFLGPHDEAYFERRARIGRMHVQIDLPQVYMLTAMDRIRVQSLAALRAGSALRTEDAERMITALHQILDMELAIMLETYREDLLAKNRTAERLATIGQFAASIGHELRNPLGVVESSAFLLSRRLAQLAIADPGLTKHVEKISAEVQRSNKTISDLLELARSRPLTRRPVAADALVAHAIAASSLAAGVEVQVSGAAGVTLDADLDQMSRVLSNLLVNAGQAMNGKGRVSIDVRREGGRAVIRVRDDGPGVPADLRARVFEALFTTKAKGTGLGLALCRRIVDAHGGALTLEPSGSGAVFQIVIPDAAAPPG